MAAPLTVVKIHHDRLGNTLTVWFGEPEEEYLVEETGDEIVLMKDKHGIVIGFEKLNFAAAPTEGVDVAFESTSS